MTAGRVASVTRNTTETRIDGSVNWMERAPTMSQRASASWITCWSSCHGTP